MTGEHVLDFEPSDTDELIRMWRESFEYGVGIKDHHPIEQQLHYFQTEICPRARVQVVKSGAQIIAFLAAHESYVAQLYVRVGHHGKGIGTLLLGLAKQQSSGTLFLHTFIRNERACRFYERHGFKAVEYGFEPMWQLEDVKYEWRRSESAA
jgi:GNAT superfamily N-acetyltransferase